MSQEQHSCLVSSVAAGALQKCEQEIGHAVRGGNMLQCVREVAARVRQPNGIITLETHETY